MGSPKGAQAPPVGETSKRSVKGWQREGGALVSNSMTQGNACPVTESVAKACATECAETVSVLIPMTGAIDMGTVRCAETRTASFGAALAVKVFVAAS